MDEEFDIDFNVPFLEAIRWADQRNVVLPEEYYGRLQGFARAQAFSVAGISSLRQIEQVLFSLNDNLESGTSFESWSDSVLAGEVDLNLPDHRLETIYRTNVQNHFAHGRWQQMSRQFHDGKPMLMYDAVNDSRTRDAHRAMDGLVRRHNDPIWDAWGAPNGFNCRCRMINLSEEQASAFVDEDAARQGDTDNANARAGAIASGPDDGWDYNPGSDPAEGTRKAAAGAIQDNPDFAGMIDVKISPEID